MDYFISEEQQMIVDTAREISDEKIHPRRVELDGERYYKIPNYHSMSPFFMSVVSGYDHWLFVSSTGGLTCGQSR